MARRNGFGVGGPIDRDSMPLRDPIPSGDSFQAPDRRHHARQTPDSLSYVHLDENNGGILINLSESGLAVQAAMSVMEDDLPRLRLQIPRSKTGIETSARVVWTGDSRRTLGLEFVKPSTEFCRHVQEWLETNVGDAAPETAQILDAEEPVRSTRVEELPLRSVRQSAAQRNQTLHDSEFDVATVFTAREMTSVSVARSTKALAESAQSRPAVAPGVDDALPVQRSEKKALAKSGTFAPLVITLAALSLAAGWEGGRGGILQPLRAFVLPSSVATTSPSSRTAAAARPANALATNFEVIDTNNQAWLVPFSGPTSAVAGPALPALPPRAKADLEKPPADSRPAAPQLSRLSAPQAFTRHSLVNASTAPLLTPQAGGALPAGIGESSMNLAAPPEINAASSAPVRSSLIEPKLVHKVQPNYPTDALNQQVEGTVAVRARIETNGTVSNVRALSGSPLLTTAAVNAVRGWKYKPEMLNGQPVASDIVVTVQFVLPR
jgi:periplasmic protein TonB